MFISFDRLFAVAFFYRVQDPPTDKIAAFTVASCDVLAEHARDRLIWVAEPVRPRTQ